MHEKAPSLTQGSVVRALVTFTVPFLLANILQSLYGAVDLFVVGRYCEARSVAAVSTGTQVTQIITSLVSGLTLGGTILIGKYTGMGDENRVRQSIATTLSVFSVVALLLTALMLLFERPLLTLLQTPQESFEETMQYVAICSWGNFFICGYNSLSAILRGYGDSKRPMLFVAIACVVNIVLDFVFVRFFALGAAGTALATVIAQAVSMFIAIFYLRRRHFLFDFKPASFRITPHIARELAFIGVPISFQELMVRISFLYLTAVMNSCGVFAAAVVPCAVDSEGPGQLNHPISCGGVPVHPGDIILADDNGVTVIPPAWVDWVLEGCEKRRQSEARRTAEIGQGQLTSAAVLGKLEKLGL